MQPGCGEFGIGAKAVASGLATGTIPPVSRLCFGLGGTTIR
jgi:hypothetical protein